MGRLTLRQRVLEPKVVLQIPNPDDWVDNIEKRLAEFVKWKEKGDMTAMPIITFVPPFTTWIMNEQLLSKFKTPTIKKSIGVGDAHEHIMAYQAAMMLMGANNVVMCRAFILTLGGKAQRWFTELSDESINMFYYLIMKFTTHLMRSWKAKKHFSYLTIVKQRSSDSLIDFLIQ